MANGKFKTKASANYKPVLQIISLKENDNLKMIANMLSDGSRDDQGDEQVRRRPQ